mmetsp:Transcript_5065/g.11447  ORF Transcript_5065/g.11447 Transcript_5065/m.11447 type:complete len:93 (-) Transcript_5065:3-281(-)
MEPKSLKKYDPTAETVVVREVPFRYSAGYDLVPRPKKRKPITDPSVMPTGVDDGHGARRLLHQYVDEAVSPTKPPPPHPTHPPPPIHTTSTN